MITQIRRAVAALVVVLLLGGCATGFDTEQARLSLVNVRPAATTVFETSVELTLRVTNETDRPLRFSGSSHRLSLNGTRVGQGVSNQEIEVPPLGTTTISVPVYLENVQLLRKFSQVQTMTDVSYRLESRLVGSRTVRTVTEGTFDLRPFTAGLR